MQTISFQPTPEDLLGAYKLNFRATLKSKRVMRAYIGGCSALAGLAAAGAWAWDIAPVWIAAAIGFGYWITFLSLIFASAYLRLPRQVRRIFDQQKSLHDETTIEWSETGISFTSSRGNSQFLWSDFVKIVRGQDAIILRQSDALMNFIPSRALSPEQLASFPVSA
ncbi:MAG: YcxB family protein [Pseudomonadota bacterium]